MIEGTADGAAKDGQYATAFDIAKQLDDAYPVGTIVKDRSFAERDSYTNISWLAGQTALTKLGRPADAIRAFELYGRAGKSPQTRVKGIYWSARAAEAAGRRDLANNYYVQASDYFDQFHGQLASERIGRTLATPTSVGTIEVSGAERTAFDRNELVRAIMTLGQMGNHEDQTRFIRTLAISIQSPVDHVLATDLATRTNRADLSVMVGRSARDKGYPDYFRSSFPQIQVPSDQAGSWTMIHAISRQESQFDREIVSHAGARGLMQLMPGTARQTAAAAGVTYNYTSLTADPQYNIRLGSTYFGQMMDTFSGSYILSVAAYNAGPGNVRKWLNANGDPRAGVDPITWIEAIPIKETRDYVQRVLENAVVYDLINPRRPANRVVTLSGYLRPGQAGFGSK
jgi:soluble lytic murein transglycosylase